eukprot:53492-Pyramimonas_sp.AAC.1
MDDDAKKYWWDFALQTEWAQRHPRLRRLMEQNTPIEHIIPLHFHQDGVEIYRDVEAQLMSFQSAWTPGDSTITKIPLVCMFEEYIKDGPLRSEFNREVCRYINYEMGILEAGVRPAMGFYGEPRSDGGKALCGPHRFVYAGTKSDGKSRRVENQFPRHSNATFVCIDCAASQPYADGPTELCYTDCGRNAGRQEWEVGGGGRGGGGGTEGEEEREGGRRGGGEGGNGGSREGEEEGRIARRRRRRRSSYFTLPGWRKTLISHDLYMRTTRPLSPWSLVEGWHKDLAFRDLTHDLYLSQAKDSIASCIVEWLEDGKLVDPLALGPPPANDVMLRAFTLKYRQWCK